jgi:hypothetical protein
MSDAAPLSWLISDLPSTCLDCFQLFLFFSFHSLLVLLFTSLSAILPIFFVDISGVKLHVSLISPILYYSLADHFPSWLT